MRSSNARAVAQLCRTICWLGVVGFASLADGMVTLAVIATLDGWVDRFNYFRVDAGKRPDNHIALAIRGARLFHNTSLRSDERSRGLMMMREAFPGCAYAWELRELPLSTFEYRMCAIWYQP